MFLCKEHVLRLLLVSNSSDSDNSKLQALHTQASNDLLLQMRRRSVESVGRYPMTDIKLQRVHIELVATATSGRQANATVVLTASTNTLLNLQDLIHLLYQLLRLLLYLLLLMVHHLHIDLLLRLYLLSRPCQQLWRTSHLWLKLACRRSLAETSLAMSALLTSCAIWLTGISW